MSRSANSVSVSPTASAPNARRSATVASAAAAARRRASSSVSSFLIRSGASTSEASPNVNRGAAARRSWVNRACIVSSTRTCPPSRPRSATTAATCSAGSSVSRHARTSSIQLACRTCRADSSGTRKTGSPSAGRNANRCRSPGSSENPVVYWRLWLGNRTAASSPCARSRSWTARVRRSAGVVSVTSGVSVRREKGARSRRRPPALIGTVATRPPRGWGAPPSPPERSSTERRRRCRTGPQPPTTLPRRVRGRHRQ